MYVLFLFTFTSCTLINTLCLFTLYFAKLLFSRLFDSSIEQCKLTTIGLQYKL